MGQRVAVVVLSYNGRELTLSCIESLRSSDWPDVEIVVVDNASKDDTLDALQVAAPDVTLIANDRNLGFPGGNNVGIRHALDGGADYVLLLNNDATVAPDCIRVLVEQAECSERPRIMCPLIYYAEPSDLIWYAGSHWDPAKIYNGGYIGRGERDIGQFRAVRETGVATGAAMLIPRAVLERIGLLAEELFLQGEDVEFSARARKAGFAIAVVPEAKVWHHVSAASGGEHSPLVTYYCTRNALHVAREYRPTGPFRRAAYELGLVSLFIAHGRHSDHVWQSWRAALDGWRDYRAGRLGERTGSWTDG